LPIRVTLVLLMPENYSMKSQQKKQFIAALKSKVSTKVDVVELANQLLSGNTIALSKAITLVESNKREDSLVAAELMRIILPHSGKSKRIGISGVPGAGKSTFIEALGMALIKSNLKVAVLAVDPSSEVGKGSILGDKTRMEQLSANANAFIRPSAASGTLGGVARKTREAIYCCEAAGYDVVLIETVGVGQSETAVNSMVDFFLLIAISGAGDELQGIKRGIMEMVHAVVINKADGENIHKAKLAKTEVKRALHFYPQFSSGWSPETLVCSAIENKGIGEVWTIIETYFEKYDAYIHQNRKWQAKWWLKESIEEEVIAQFYLNKAVEKELPIIEKDVVEMKLSVSEALLKLMTLNKE
jgi:LAO/AO transport system kinase